MKSKKSSKNELDFGQNALLYIVHGFWPKSENFDFGKKTNPGNSASQGEQNGEKVSSIAPSKRSKKSSKNELDFGQNALL